MGPMRSGLTRCNPNLHVHSIRAISPLGLGCEGMQFKACGVVFCWWFGSEYVELVSQMSNCGINPEDL